LIRKLFQKYDIFIENDFDIDFVTEFPSIKSLTDFERCLLRLYHRIYLTNYANKLAEDHPDQVILTSRGVYDSQAYIHTYHQLGRIPEDKFKTLDFISNHLHITPYTIVLNPPFEVGEKEVSFQKILYLLLQDCFKKTKM
jgi:hypothetical protein